MRYLRFVLFVALLGISAVPFTSGVVSAQDDEDLFAPCEPRDDPPANRYWDGVCEPQFLPDVLIENPILPNIRLLPYAVTFMEAAPESESAPLVGSTQRIENTELMIVIVKQGCFALDVSQPDSVVVSSPRNYLTILSKVEESEPDVTFFEETEGTAPSICTTPVGTPAPDDATPDPSTTLSCEVSCVIEPMPDRAVLLAEGDVAFAEPGAICLWCLTHARVTDDGVAGGLEVLALVDPDNPDLFSWKQAWINAPLEEEERALPPAYMSSSSAIRAFAFNPGGSRCHGS